MLLYIHIPSFVCGMIATVILELVLSTIGCIIFASRHEKEKDNE